MGADGGLYKEESQQLIGCAIDMLRLRARSGRLLSLVLLFEVCYFFAVGFFWMEPTIGQSIAAATGVANGGMMAQFLILFPIWAPILLAAT